MWGDQVRSGGEDLDAADVRFARKLARFDEADARFQTLADALQTYRDAVGAVADAGVAVADALASFFEEGASTPNGAAGPTTSSGSMRVGLSSAASGTASGTAPVLDASELASTDGNGGGALGASATSSAAGGTQPSIAAAFRAAQMAIRSKWTQDVMQRYDDDVCKHVNDSLSQFPQVRTYIKQRNVAQQELARRQKKLKDAGPRVRDKQRKWRECSDRYKMFDDEVMQRFSNIDRAQPGLVARPLRQLVLLLEEFSRDSSAALRDVAVLVTAAAPVVTRDFTPPPRHDDLLAGLSLGNQGDEGWDDAFDFPDDTASGSAVSHGGPLSAGEGPKQITDGKLGSDVKPAPGSSSVPTHSRAHSAASPTRVHAAIENSRRAASGPPATFVGTGRRRQPSLGADSIEAMLNNSAPAVSSSAKADDGSRREPHAVAVEELTQSLPSGLPASESAKDLGSEQDSRSERRNVLMRLAATYDFTPSETNELPLRAGDVIEVYEKHDSGWWLGKANRLSGYFPRDYTRNLTEEEEVEYLNEKSRRRRERRKGHRRRDSGLSASQTSNPPSATQSSSVLSAAKAAQL